MKKRVRIAALCMALCVSLTLLCGCGLLGIDIENEATQSQRETVYYSQLSDTQKGLIDFILGKEDEWDSIEREGKTYKCTSVSFTTHEGNNVFSVSYRTSSSGSFYNCDYAYSASSDHFELVNETYVHVSSAGNSLNTGAVLSGNYNVNDTQASKRNILADRYAYYLEQQNQK